jgi:hypothetical protein
MGTEEPTVRITSEEEIRAPLKQLPHNAYNLMRVKKPSKRNAWLITWESSRDDYLADLKRTQVVAILKPQLSSSTIAALLPVLFISESKLTFR